MSYSYNTAGEQKKIEMGYITCHPKSIYLFRSKSPAVAMRKYFLMIFYRM
jgi:hypothetical protein